jgi:hypothetical protein
MFQIVPETNSEGISSARISLVSGGFLAIKAECHERRRVGHREQDRIAFCPIFVPVPAPGRQHEDSTQAPTYFLLLDAGEE